MPLSDPLRILLAHNLWATRQILDACEPLTPEQFHHQFEIGPGSLHHTIRHIIGAMHRWTDVLNHRPMRPRIEEQGEKTVPQLRSLLEQASADLAAQADAPLDATANHVRDGVTRAYTSGAIFTHVTTHGMHHRAQCLNMLRQLGVKPLPLSSVAEWTWTES